MVREVLERLRREGQGREAGGGGGGAGKRLLAVFTGTGAGLEQALEALATLAKTGWNVSAYVSPWAEKTFGAETVARLGAVGEILRDGDVADCGAAAEKVDAVMVGTLSRNAAAKVALLAPDSTATELILQGLLKGKAVVAAVDGVEAEMASAPPAMRNIVQGYLRTLTELGVVLVGAGELAEGTAAALGFHAARRGGKGWRVILTSDEVEDALRRGEKAITLPADAIVTVAAADRARELGVELRRAEW